MTSTVDSIGFGLMCKPPRPGVSKTRLAAAIGHEAAARLSAAMLEDCARAAERASVQVSLALTGFYRPLDAAAEIGTILGGQWPLEFADAGALGSTMRDILRRLRARSPGGAIIMGADVPMIEADVIAAAARSLLQGSERRVVIAPSADGGYCLIGARSVDAVASLFEQIAWSTPEVLAQTLARARAANLDVVLLPEQHDIDEVQDLHWLGQVLAARPGAASATRRILETIALSPRG